MLNIQRAVLVSTTKLNSTVPDVIMFWFVAMLVIVVMILFTWVSMVPDKLELKQ